MAGDPAREIDEEARRRFEASRLAGGNEPLEAFLPAAADPRYGATVEELACIDLEFALKAGREGRLDEYMERFPVLREEPAATRLRNEEVWLRRRFGPAVSRRVGRYQLMELAGRGAFAEVWRAFDADLRREVAVKLTRPELADSTEVLERVYREARSAAQLRHPCIVPVHEVAAEDGQPFIVSDFIRGPTLARLLRERDLPVEEAARQLARIAEAVEYAHQCGVIHRDLKPGNILMSDDGRPLLTDFGLAQLAGAEAVLTRQGDVLGTPAYMSPEQARGDTARIGPRSDVYGLGAVLYEMLTRRRLFDGRNGAGVLYGVLHDDPPAPRALRPEIPLDLETICLKALAKEPERRYASAGALAEDLHRFLAHQPIQARRHGPVARARLWVRRNRTLAATLALSAAAVLVVGLVGLSNVLQERDRYLRERDLAQANLLRARSGEAEALLRARGASWYDRAMDSLREAAKLARDDEERSVLRDLVIRCQGVANPTFHLLDEWDARGSAVRQLDGDDKHAAWIVDGRVQLRDLRSGASTEIRLDDERSDCLAFVPGGRLLVTGSREGSLRVWSLGDVPSAAASVRLAGAVTALAASADGTRLAAAVAGGAVEIRSLPDLGEVRTLAGHHDGTLALAFSPGGESLATGGMDATVRLWDVATGRAVWAFGTDDPVRTVAFAPDGSSVAYATHETYGFGRISLAPIPVRKAHMSLHEGSIRRLAFHGPGRIVAASADGSLRCWSDHGDEVAVARAGVGAVHTMAVIGGTRRILSAHADGRLRLWELHEPPSRIFFGTQHAAVFVPGTRELAIHSALVDLSAWPAIRTRALDGGSVRALVADPRDGAVLCGKGDGWIVTSAASGGELGRFRAHDSAVVALAVDGAGARLASAGERGLVKTWRRDGEWLADSSVATDVGAIHALAWDAPSGTLVAAGETGVELIRDGSPCRIALAPVHRRAVVVGGGMLAVAAAGGAIETYDVRDLRRLRSWTAHADAVTALVLLPARGLLASAGLDGEVAIWSLRDGSKQRVKHDGAAPFAWLAADPPHSLLAAGDEGTTVLAIDLDTMRPVAELELLSSSCGAFSRAGTLLVGSPNGSVWGWDAGLLRAEALRLARAAERGEGSAPARIGPSAVVLSGGHRLPVWGVAASPDGRFVATTAHAGAVKLWDASTGRLVRDLQVAGPLSWSAAFSPDSRTLAACCGGNVILFDVESGKERARLRGHEALVVHVAFHPRLPILGSVARDRTLRLWDLQRDEPLGEPWRAQVPVHALCIDPEGTLLAVACGDGRVRLWHLDRAGWSGPREPDRILDGHESAVWAVAFDPTGRYLASGSERGRVVLRDARSLHRLASLQGETRLIRSLSFDETGEHLAVGCYSSPSIAWDLTALNDLLRSMELGW